MDIADIYKNSGDFDQAIIYYLKAVVNPELSKYKLYKSIAETYSHLGEQEKVDEYVKKAEDVLASYL